MKHLMRHKPVMRYLVHPPKKNFVLAMIVIVFSFLSCLSVHAQTWVEDTFEDFRDGRLDASGQNIYVARDGTIRTIHRFDINRDGYIDLLFNSTHDTCAFIPATMAVAGPGRQVGVSRLAVEGSIQAQVADFDRDGWSDIVFCPNASGVQHPRRFLTIIYGGPDGWPSSRSGGLLPVYGAIGIAVADLNRDGRPDIGVLNQKAWMPGQPDGNIVRIYWGDARGFLLTRYRDIGIPEATGIFSSDFDGDGAGDVAVPAADGRILFLWGGGSPADSESKDGSSKHESPADSVHSSSSKKGDEIETSEWRLPFRSPLCLGSGDLGKDGLSDLVIGSEKDSLYVLQGKARREWSEPKEMKGINASNLSLSDLDGDGYPDLVATFFSLTRAAGGEQAAGKASDKPSVSVLWGSSEGFSPSRSTLLDCPQASATAVADMDGDGKQDIAVAVYQGDKTFAGESRILFNRGGRTFEPAANRIPTEGALQVTIAAAEKGLSPRAVFCNSQGGSLREEAPLLLYWGGAKGFAPENLLRIPFRSGYEATAADLNGDGFVDLVALDSMHAGQSAEADPYAGANIFWGSAQGFDFEKRRTILKEASLGTSNVADLNQDGYLDLVLGQFANGDKPTEAIIYYGTAEGYDRAGRVALPSEGRSISSLIADFNNDGWLDIGVNSYDKNLVRLFWGSAGGFSEKAQTILDVPGVIDLETADLNGDGRLDLIACSYMDPVTGHHDTGIIIFWGGEEGFRPSNVQRLPAWTPLAPVVADFDGDGFLDIFLPHYHGELTRERLPSYLYWGSRDGFSPRNRTVLVNDSAADGLAADFDHDGRLDLAVNNHTVDGDHHALSRVFYNDGRRFENPRVEALPTHGPHWMWNEDIGHIATRRYEQRYESSVFAWKSGRSRGRIETAEYTPSGAGQPGTSVIIEVKSAASQSGLEREPWRKVEGGEFSLKPGDRCLRYRLTYLSDNGDRYPVLDKVVLALR